MPTLDFWTFLVLLLIFTIVFCVWLYFRNVNFFESDVYVSIYYDPLAIILKWKVVVFTRLPDTTEDITKEVLKKPDNYNLWFEDEELAVRRGIALANKYNLEFRYHES